MNTQMEINNILKILCLMFFYSDFLFYKIMPQKNMFLQYTLFPVLLNKKNSSNILSSTELIVISYFVIHDKTC